MVENQIQLFNNPEFGGVRAIMRDGEPWFVASDVATALGFANPSDAVNRHCKKPTKTAFNVIHEGANNPAQINLIPVSDVFRLIMRSNLPKAEEFQTWVCEEVLPAIRNTGSYSMALPQSYSAALRALADKAEALEAAQEELASTQDMLAEVTEQRNKAQLDLSIRNAARTKREITRKAERGAPCKYQVRVFTHPQFGAIRTAIYNGAPHFVVGDLITALESPTKVWTRKKTVIGEGLVPESGVIPFIRGANPPEAAEFCRWLLLEIMPVLQKNTR